MAKLTTYICDGCGKTIDQNLVRITIEEEPKPGFITHLNRRSEYELCLECSVDIAQHFKRSTTSSSGL